VLLCTHLSQSHLHLDVMMIGVGARLYMLDELSGVCVHEDDMRGVTHTARKSIVLSRTGPPGG
jgi:hypothetical protein